MKALFVLWLLAVVLLVVALYPNREDGAVPEPRGRRVDEPMTAGQAGRLDAPRLVGFPRRNDDPADLIQSHRQRDLRPTDLPSFTITLTTRSWRIYDSAGRQIGRISLADAGVLQSFPRDYPWQGDSRRAVFGQVANAVPPRLAASLLETLLW